MKLDTRSLRYLTGDDWRTLAAVEQGSKNHELVPTPLIQQIAGLRSGGNSVQKCISTLAKASLIAKVKNAKYDGYRLTSHGQDYLALHTHRRSNTIFSLGNQLGVGKESDIYITASSTNRQQILKLHRLGRISFRSVKNNRDYLRHRSTGSWHYLSLLAARKEYEVMRVLWREGFVVPEPIALSRHTVVMEFIDAFPLRMIERVPEPGTLYGELMDMVVQLAQRGLIHGDFNEFNILVKEAEEEDENGTIKLTPVMIDFPQTVSTNHVNAKMYFDRDVACVKRYFSRRFGYVSDEPGPFFEDAVRGIDAGKRLDIEVEASGFSKKMERDLEKYVGNARATEGEAEDGIEDDEEDLADHDERSGDEGEDEDVLEDPEVGEPELAQELRSLSMRDDLAVKPLRPTEYGLIPLELPREHDVVAGEMHARKKAAGWAI